MKLRRDGLTLFSALVVACLLAVPPIEAAAPSQIEYELILDCPETRGTLTRLGADPASLVCPIRATDEDDIMGSPSVAVDPKDTNNLVLASLHGTDADGPSHLSRGRQPFTTFLSRDHGARWEDRPYTPPQKLNARTRDVFGEHPQAVVDYWGHVYIGSLYSIRDRAKPNGWNYTIQTQKFTDVDQVIENQKQSQDFNAQPVDMYFPGNVIEQFWFVHDPKKDIMTVVWNEKMPGSPLWSCPKADVRDAENDESEPVGGPVTGRIADFSQIDYLAACVAEDSSNLYVIAVMAAPPNPATGQEWTYTLEFEAKGKSYSGRLIAQGARRATNGFPGLDAEIQENVVRFTIPKDKIEVATGDTLTGLVLSSRGVYNPASAAAPSEAIESSDRAPDTGSAFPEEKPFTVGSRLDLAYSNGERSAIGLAWTRFRQKGPYTRFKGPEIDRLIGPCLEVTNPVVAQSQIYMGCVVNTEEGAYAWDPTPHKGQIDLFRIPVGTANVTYLGSAPIQGGLPRLGVRQDGRVVLMSIEKGLDGTTTLQGVFGQADKARPSMEWGDPRNYGDEILERSSPGRQVIDTSLQDIMYREQSGVVHVILKERFLDLGNTLDKPLTAVAPHFKKRLLALDENHGVLAKYDFDVGELRNRTALRTDPKHPEDVFDDLTDDIFQLPAGPYNYTRRNGEIVELGDTYVREFFAVGDYGIVLFGELIEVTNLRAPPVVPPIVPPVPIAAPALAQTVAQVLVGAGVVSVVGLLATKLALARRTSPATAITKAGK